MKKYFCIETDEQVNFGDELHLTFFKETENGKVTVEKSTIFTEDTLDQLIGLGFIEEREVEEEDDNTSENSLLDFGDEAPCEALEALEEDFEDLEDKVESLEQEIEQLKGMHKDYVALTNKMLDTFKDFILSLPDEEEKKNVQPKKK